LALATVLLTRTRTRVLAPGGIVTAVLFASVQSGLAPVPPKHSKRDATWVSVGVEPPTWLVAVCVVIVLRRGLAVFPIFAGSVAFPEVVE
jgi:hypothetical protein